MQIIYASLAGSSIREGPGKLRVTYDYGIKKESILDCWGIRGQMRLPPWRNTSGRNDQLYRPTRVYKLFYVKVHTPDWQ